MRTVHTSGWNRTLTNIKTDTATRSRPPALPRGPPTSLTHLRVPEQPTCALGPMLPLLDPIVAGDVLRSQGPHHPEHRQPPVLQLVGPQHLIIVDRVSHLLAPFEGIAKVPRRPH